MSSVELLCPRDRGWQQYLTQASHDVFHFPGYHDLCAVQSGSEAWLAVYGDQDKFIAWPYLIQPITGFDSCPDNTVDISSVYGYVGPIAHNCAFDGKFLCNAWKAFLDTWRSQRAVSLFTRFHPVLENDKFVCLSAKTASTDVYGGPYAQGRVVVIDLSRPEDGIWNGYRPKLRRALFRCQRAGLTSTMDSDWNHLDDFVRLYHCTMARNHAIPFYFFSRNYFQQLKEILRSHGKLIVTKQGNEVASAALLIEYRGVVNVHLLASSEQFLNLAPSKLTIHDAAIWANSRGNRLLILGGGRGSRDDDPLFRFKSLFSQTTMPFYTGRWTLDASTYQKLEREWRRRDRMTLNGKPMLTHFPIYRTPLKTGDMPDVDIDNSFDLDHSESPAHVGRG
jgi:hypothetical protein